MKVCSAYGAGFYFIPGTDICLRVGGYVHIETGYNGRGAVPLIYAASIGGDHILNRDDNRVNWRVNNGFIMDARTQSPIGTVRAYIQMGGSWVNSVGGAVPGAAAVNFERAFIQFAGITAGLTESWFSFVSPGYTGSVAFASVAWHWAATMAYTAQFGNGFSGTIAIEDGQAYRTRIDAVGATAYTGTTAPTANTYGGQEIPDIVANLRVDQAWGSAQISGALHQLRLNQATAAAFSDKFGWAVLGGIEIKTPMIAPGDGILLQGVWSKGAVEYTGISSSPVAGVTSIGLKSGAGIGVGPLGWIYDAVPSLFTGSLELTTAWSVSAHFRHFWQPNLRSAIWFGYNKVEPAKPNPAFNYGPDTAVIQAGVGTIWSPAPTLDLDLSLLWTRVETGACPNAAAPIQAASCNQSADIWTVWTRWRRNF